MILAAGLTPAWQQIMMTPRLVPGSVNRAAEVVWCASGKVLNVGCALHHLGAKAITLSPCGGFTGAAMRQDFSATGAVAHWVESTVPTRVCTTILDQSTGQSTELVENSAGLSERELERFAQEFASLASRAAMIVISGSLPHGTPRDYYALLLQNCTCPVLLDLRGPELLACLPRRPWLVKPNRDELAATVGRTLTTDTELLAAMQELRSAGATYVVVSDGPRAMWAAGPDGVHCVTPNKVPVVNPIGCGDCLAAGLAGAWCDGRTWRDCVDYGVAAAAENAQQLLPARLSKLVR